MTSTANHYQTTQGKLTGRHIVTTKAEDLRQAALAHCPDAVAVQRMVKAGRHNVEVAGAQRYRDPDVALEYQHDGMDNTAGATVSFPLAANQAYFVYRLSLSQLEQATGKSWTTPQ